MLHTEIENIYLNKSLRPISATALLFLILLMVATWFMPEFGSFLLGRIATTPLVSFGAEVATLTQRSDQTVSPSPLTSETLPASAEESARKNLGMLGVFPQRSKVEFTLHGPDSAELSESENPFAILVDVTFSGPDGRTFTVPAFFAGDGKGGQEGEVWLVRFAPDFPGRWLFISRSVNPRLDGYRGEFEVEAAESCQAPSIACLGTLQYAGGHYLRFSGGNYWIKGGVDDPENFLGDAFGSWQAKKDALDYLSSKGVNSIYVITNNIDGDRNDTWPWVGATPAEAKANSDRFNNAKLQQWEDFFTYAENLGIVLHIILNDDSAWNGYDHDLYFREMVARFAHHPGLIWNIGEEANEIYSDQQQILHAQKLRQLDAYDHPITVHRRSPWPFLNTPHFDLTSIQSGGGANDFSTTPLSDLNEEIIFHREESVRTCRAIPVMIDETPRVTRVDAASQFKMRSQVLYPIFLGGGNYELHYRDAYGQGGTLTIEQLAPMLEDMRRARHFVEDLPFNEMSPCNELISGQGRACFGKIGDVYAVYLPDGGSVSLNLTGGGGSFNVTWFNPRNGNSSNAGSVAGNAIRSFTAPNNQDWVLKLDNPQVQAGQMTSVDLLSNQTFLADLATFRIFLPMTLQRPGTLCAP